MNQHAPDPPPPSKLLMTTDLLHQAQRGDAAAMEILMSRYLPRLNRWATGRLPANARSLLETNDLVHETLLRAIEGLGRIEETTPGQFQAYLRQAILNRIRDQMRWAHRRAGSKPVSEDLVDSGASPLEDAIGADLLARYERAREQLNEDERLFIHLRIELDFDYDDIAAIMSRPSRGAARMGVQRALRKLARLIGPER